MIDLPKRSPHDAPGDFYVVADCCIWCGVMHAEAPGLIGWVSTEEATQGCFVAKQPVTFDELEQMIAAMAVQDVGCVRYGGNDPVIVKRLIDADIGLESQIDDLRGDGAS